MSEITIKEVRKVVAEETADLRADVAVLKTDVAILKTDVSELKEDVSELKEDVTELKDNVRDLAVLFEDFGDKMDAIAELVTTTVKTRREVDEMEPRMEKLEADNALYREVLKQHSSDLKALKAASAK